MSSISQVQQDNLRHMFTANVGNKSNSSLGVDDFLKLIVAQIQNQDMMNPMNDTEFFSQMAQFSTLQSMQDLTAMYNTTYSASLLGKEATAAKMVDQRLQTVKGVITGVGLFDGDPIIYIGNDKFKLNEIMVLGSMTEKEEEATLGIKPAEKTEETEETTKETDTTETK